MENQKTQNTVERLEKIQCNAMEAIGMKPSPNGNPKAYLKYLSQIHITPPEIEEDFHSWGKRYPISRYQNKISFLKTVTIFHELNQMVTGLAKQAIFNRKVPVWGRFFAVAHQEKYSPGPARLFSV